jgi:autotransporter-associated beta strand protein/autotransporter passenger strand-loop-strand repeat protein
MKINLLKGLLRSTAAKLIAAFLMSGAVQESQAVVFLWNNTGTNWTSPTSWTNGIQPSSTSSSTTTDEIQFGNFGANNNTVVLTSTRAARNITFLANANPYLINSFNGAQILSSSGGITNNSTATQTFNILVENANNSNTWFQATGGTLVFNNVASLTTAASSTSRTLTLAGDGAFTFNNELKQGGLSTAGIVKHIGAGTVTMNGTNTLAGGFEITGGGTVIVNGTTGVGQGLVTMSNGSSKLVVNSTSGLSVLNSFKGSSSLANMSTVDLAGSNSVATTTYAVNKYEGGNMSFTNHGGYKTLLQFTNATSLLTASAGTSGGRRLFNNSTNLTVQFDGTLDIGGTTADNSLVGGVGDFLFKGSLFNTAAALRGLTKSGTGTATFQAVNAYNGETTIQEGTFVVDTAGSIASSAAVVSGGTLRVKGIAGSVAANSGNLIVDSTGTIGNFSIGVTTTVSVDGTTGTITQGGGTLDMRGTGSTFSMSAGTATVYSGGFLGNSTLTGGSLLNSGTVGETTIASGSTFDVKTGGTASQATVNGGTLLVSGSVAQTVVNSGIATVNSGGNSGITTVNGSTLDVYGRTGISTVNTGGTLNVKSGGSLLGTSTVGGGTLLVEGTAGTVVVNSGTATVNTGGVIGSTTINGSLLSVNGSAGDVLVNTGGTLGGSGSVQGLTLNGGTVAPGNSPGLLSAYELNGSNGTFQFQLGAPTTRGTTYDAINVTTLLTLGANTNFTFETLDNYTYADGNIYDLFDWGSTDMSSFDVAVLEAALPNLNTPSTDLKWNVSNFTMDGTVGVIPEPSTGSLMAFAVASLITLKVIRRKKCQRQTHS